MSTIRDPLIILSNYLQCASKLVMFVNNDTPVSTTLLIIDKTPPPLPFSSMLPYVAKDSWNHSTTLFYSFIFWGGGGVQLTG